MSKSKLAILASGNGSNAEAIMQWASTSSMAEVVCVGSNVKSAFVLSRAQKFNVPTIIVAKKKNEEKESYDQRLLEKLNTFSPDWIVLAGFMKLLTPIFLSHYENRVINIHPSLLPAFPGLDGYGDAFKAGVSESGCTVHYVDEGVDTGAIIAQKKIPFIPGESFDDFKKRALFIENQFYPEVIENLLKRKY
ncbi:MAG: phosphoribosylglycinamide formyltransferase [Bacteriovorax sp.]